MKKIFSIFFFFSICLNLSAQFRKLILRPRHGQIIGQFKATNQPLRAWIDRNGMYVIQGEMDNFVVRGANMLTRTDVQSDYKNYSKYFVENTPNNGLSMPQSFQVPKTCIKQESTDGTFFILCGQKASDVLTKAPKPILVPQDQTSTIPSQKPTSSIRRGAGIDMKLAGFPKINEGVSYLKADGSVKEVVSKLNIENGKLSEQLWNRSFFNDNQYEKGYYIGLGEKSTTSPLQNLDVSGMEGFDLSVIEVYTEKAKFWNARNWVQHYITVPGKRMVTDTLGNVVYFWNPGQHVSESVLPDFYNSFPEFTLPKGKIVKFSYASGTDIDGTKATKRGVSFVHNAKDPQKRALTDYDGWLYDAGCPRAYTVPQEVLNSWLAGVNQNLLRKNFANVVAPNINTGFLSLNFEAIGIYNNNENVKKIGYAFQEFKTQNAQGEFAIYGLNPKFMSRPLFAGGNSQGMTQVLKWNGSGYQAYNQAFSSMQTMPIWLYLRDALTVSLVGGYCNDIRETDMIYHLMTEGLVAKKIEPNKKALSNIWHEIEIRDWQLGEENHQTSRGEVFKIKTKPIVPPDLMQSWGVWSLWLDGIDLWSDPNTKVDNPDLWGSKGMELNGDRFKENRFGERLSSYPFQSQKNIDWLMAGVWAMSMNKDILEANTAIEYPDVILPDGRKVTGDNKLPTEAFGKGFPLVMKKRDDNSNDILYTAYWGHNAANKVTKIIVDGNEIQIKGQYTSVVRVLGK